MNLDPKVPDGPLADKWTRFKRDQRLINPANKRKYTVLVVGSGLAGGSAAATLAELGYKVACFCYQDSPRRAHSIAAQGGINAAKNYRNDGDSVYRLFYDTIKGGDFRSREANVHRLAEESVNIIDQCVAQGVPFAREYGGLLDTRSFGGAQLQRTFYCRGQTGQQLMLGAYQALSRQIAAGNVTMYPRCEMLDLVMLDGRARGIVTRHLETGTVESFAGDAVVLATGGYGNVFYLSTNANGCNVSATYRAYKRGAAFANPCYTQIHPTCIPVSGDHQSKLTLMSESLRNDGRVWAPKNAADVGKHPKDIPEEDRDYYLERKYRSFGNLAPRDIASRAAKEACDDGRGVGPGGRGVYLDFGRAIQQQGKDAIAAKYGNLFDMYERITAESGYDRPMRIYPAVHYTMGGLWVNYELMSNLDGLFVAGEANFSDHGANRLGASALMQGLADGYFVLPYTLTHWLADKKPGDITTEPRRVQAVRDRGDRQVEETALHKGEEDRDRVAPRGRQGGVGRCRHGPLPGEPRTRDRPRPRAPGRVLGERERAGVGRRPEHRPRTRQPGVRLHGVRRTPGPRRPDPRGVVRRALPGRVPDGRGRGEAERRRLHPRRRVGVRRPGQRPDPQHRTARVREREVGRTQL